MMNQKEESSQIFGQDLPRVGQEGDLAASKQPASCLPEIISDKVPPWGRLLLRRESALIPKGSLQSDLMPALGKGAHVFPGP